MLTNTDSHSPEPVTTPVSQITTNLPASGAAGRASIAIRSPLANIVVVLASLGLLAWSVGFFKTRAASIISVDAVINTNLIDLKSPEEGILEVVNAETGKPVTAQATMFQIRNTKVSDLQTQTLTSRLNQSKAALAKALASVSQQEQLATLVAQDSSNQTILESAEASTEIQQIQADIEGAKSRHRLAADNHRRLSQLQAAGAIPEIQVDVARSEMEQRASDITSMEAKIDSLRVNQAAISQGLTLSRTRSNYDPAIRLQEIELNKAQINQEINGLEQQIRDTNAEIVQAKRDSQMRQEGQVQAPISGIVWSLQAKSGQYVQRGESLGKLADCNQRWVDAIVDDNRLSGLQVGTPAKFQVRGTASDVMLTGKVQMIRSGLGRLNAGDDVMTPVERHLPHQTQVRVALDNTMAQPAIATATGPAGNLCHIGYTGRVAFDVTLANSQPQSIWQRFSNLFQRLSS
jgi:multidrug resistance efflux pump